VRCEARMSYILFVRHEGSTRREVDNVGVRCESRMNYKLLGPSSPATGRT
jgi:hypothetical protein